MANNRSHKITKMINNLKAKERRGNETTLQRLCRKEYFRQYYLANKNKYIKENKEDLPKKKRGRPKKEIPPFSITRGEFKVCFN